MSYRNYFVLLCRKKGKRGQPIIYSMYYTQSLENILFLMFYGGVTFASVIACIYLLFRRGNAFASDVTSPVRLRRWAAVFFVVATLSHVWWMPFSFLNPWNTKSLYCMLAVFLDCVTIVPTIMAIMLCMLQDRRRPLWPIAVAMLPFVCIMAAFLTHRIESYIQYVRGYFLFLVLVQMLYMLHAIRQYRRWLRDNYADLEHKEVWQSLVVLFVILICLAFYSSGTLSLTYEYVVQVNDLLILGIMLWRVETLQQLDDVAPADQETDEVPKAASTVPLTLPSNIGQLLELHCENTQLYLQQGLTLYQLSAAVGTNRYYLSQYFSRQGTTYNSYINSLRIRHFIDLYEQAVASRRRVTAQQLADESGFRSYSTFGIAFKQVMGTTVTAWMRNERL